MIQFSRSIWPAFLPSGRVGRMNQPTLTSEDPDVRQRRVHLVSSATLEAPPQDWRESGQSQGDGVQGQAHASPHHRAVDANELQIAA